jgi:hypothetical protein
MMFFSVTAAAASIFLLWTYFSFSI